MQFFYALPFLFAEIARRYQVAWTPLVHNKHFALLWVKFHSKCSSMPLCANLQCITKKAQTHYGYTIFLWKMLGYNWMPFSLQKGTKSGLYSKVLRKSTIFSLRKIALAAVTDVGSWKNRIPNVSLFFLQNFAEKVAFGAFFLKSKFLLFGKDLLLLALYFLQFIFERLKKGRITGRSCRLSIRSFSSKIKPCKWFATRRFE